MTRSILGTDLSGLDGYDQFGGFVQGRTLILDGDGPCYVAAATVKRLDTAVSRFQQAVLARMFITSCENARVHLTASNSDKFGRFRVKAAKPYQGQRKSKDKPSLLEPLREAMADRSNWLEQFDTVQLHRDVEADDAMMCDAYEYKEHGVISSEDKDLRMTPYLYHEMKVGKVMQGEPEGWVDLAYTDSGTAKLTGQGPMFFWLQMLAGDTADNIQGIRRLNGALCGPAGAVAALRGVRTQSDAANAVLDAYRAIDQNAVAEGWLLWLKRNGTDNVVKYMQELNLSPANADFIQDCVRRDWVTPREQDERE